MHHPRGDKKCFDARKTCIKLRSIFSGCDVDRIHFPSRSTNRRAISTHTQLAGAPRARGCPRPGVQTGLKPGQRPAMARRRARHPTPSKRRTLLGLHLQVRSCVRAPGRGRAGYLHVPRLSPPHLRRSARDSSSSSSCRVRVRARCFHSNLWRRVYHFTHGWKEVCDLMMVY